MKPVAATLPNIGGNLFESLIIRKFSILVYARIEYIDSFDGE